MFLMNRVNIVLYIKLNILVTPITEQQKAVLITSYKSATTESAAFLPKI